MKRNLLSLLLALLAGSLAITAFVYKWTVKHQKDYAILFAGICVLSFGASVFFNKKR